MRSYFAALIGLSLTLVASTAQAHIHLLHPPARTESQKLGPCGAGPDDLRGPTVAEFKPGEKLLVRWDEFVDHPGHYRIAFDPDGQASFFDPKSFDDMSGGPGVLMDGIPDHAGGGTYEQEITLPNIECSNCVLQLIQMMTDKPPYGDGNDLYYQCADIALIGEVAMTTTDDPSTTTGDDTSDSDDSATSDPPTTSTTDATTTATAGNGSNATPGMTDPTTASSGNDADSGSSSGNPADDPDSGCACNTTAPYAPSTLLLGLVAWTLTRRRTKSLR